MLKGKEKVTKGNLTFNQRVLGSNPSGITIFLHKIIGLIAARKYRVTAFVLFSAFVLFNDAFSAPSATDTGK
jgi:hypothetical protein